MRIVQTKSDPKSPIQFAVPGHVTGSPVQYLHDTETEGSQEHRMLILIRSVKADGKSGPLVRIGNFVAVRDEKGKFDAVAVDFEGKELPGCEGGIRGEQYRVLKPSIRLALASYPRPAAPDKAKAEDTPEETP